MNLHTVEALEPAPPQPGPVCPCGSRTFIRTYSESVWGSNYVSFDERGICNNESYDADDGEITDTGPWKCFACDALVTDETADTIDDNR
jgi:hypothetical protein